MVMLHTVVLEETPASVALLLTCLTAAIRVTAVKEKSRVWSDVENSQDKSDKKTHSGTSVGSRSLGVLGHLVGCTKLRHECNTALTALHKERSIKNTAGLKGFGKKVHRVPNYHISLHHTLQ